MTALVVPARQLEDIAASIREQYERGKRGYEAAIEAQFAIGRDLRAARSHLTSDNAFGAWFEAQSFPFSRQWAWTLRAAAEREPEVREMVASQLATGSQPNVERALAAVRSGVHFTSNTPEWYTPPEIITRARSALGGIDLDPCSNEGEPNVPARRHYTATDDGLAKEWRGRVYMNPPYGDVIAGWVGKLCDEYAAGRVASAIALVPARTDTAWWALLRDSTLCLVRGRLRFSESVAGAPFPSAVAYMGRDPDRFARSFRDMGDIWKRVR